MKTLKKTLCLVLVLALTVSMFAVAASAASYDKYADAEATTASKYAEAMDVAIGLGIINGVEGNKVAIDNTLNRAMAAKILCYLMLGADAAESLAAGNTQFNDVPVNHWANKYISYAASKGILVGSNGAFNPGKEVTGYALAKMILNAMDYGFKDVMINNNGIIEASKVNTYEGSYWTTNITMDNAKYGVNLFTNLKDVDLNKALTRGQAMQMVFNALTNGKAGHEIANYKIYKYGTEVDGLSYNSWTTEANNAKKVVTGAYLLDTKVATYAAGTAYKTIAADLGVTATKSVTAQYYANGKAKGDALTIDKTYLTSTAKVPTGITVDVYLDTNGNYKLMATVTYVVKASAGTLVTDKTSANYGKYEYTFGDYTAAKVYAAKDAYKGYYAVVPAGDNTAATKHMSINAVAPVTAKATKYSTTAETVTVNGIALPVAKVANINYADASFTTNMNYYIYNGVLYVIDTYTGEAPATVALDGYVYVTEIATSYTKGSGSTILNAAKDDVVVARAKVVNTYSATPIVVDLAVYTVKNATTGAVEGYKLFNANGPAIVEGTATAYAGFMGWQGFTSTEGKVALYNLTADAFKSYAKVETLGNAIAKKDVTVLNGRYTNSATKYTVINTKDNTITTVTGIANIAIAQGTEILTTVSNAKSTTVENIFVLKTTTDVVDTTASYAYVAAVGGTVLGGTEYTIYVDGKAVSCTYNGTLTVGNVYKNLKLNAKDQVTATGDDLGAVKATADNGFKVEILDETFYVLKGATTAVKFQPGVVVYNVTTGTAGTADVVEVGDYIVALDGGKVIYIVDAYVATVIA